MGVPLVHYSTAALKPQECLAGVQCWVCVEIYHQMKYSYVILHIFCCLIWFDWVYLLVTEITKITLNVTDLKLISPSSLCLSPLNCKHLLDEMIAVLPYLVLFWHPDFLFSPLPLCPCWDSLQDRQACRPMAAVLQMSCVSKTLTFQPPASALYRWFCHRATLNIPLKPHISSLCQVFHQL